MDQHKGFWERIAEYTDLPDESFPGESIVELVGDRRIIVENHRGVTEYSHERISIRLRRGILTVGGAGLELTRMTKDLLVIAGTVNCIFVQRGKNV